MRLAKESLITSSNINYLSNSAYDQTKWNLGKGLIFNNGATESERYVSPLFAALHPLEENTAFAVSYIFSVNFSSTYEYVFGIENSVSATATRRVALWTVNKKTGSYSWNGFITLTLANATAHTVRDFKIDRKQETAGTVAVSGTSVTGTGTAWTTNKVAQGARIGFGSTDPTQITNWYRISTIASNGSITLSSTAPTFPASTAYIIEEYRPVYIATNATTTNGGIHYAKGVSLEDFTSNGTTISLATTVDDQKAVYWIKDASTQTNTVSAGCALDFSSMTATTLDCYVMDLVSAGNYKFYKYNLRGALTVTSGASTSAFVLATGNNPFTGTGSQNSALAISTAGHGSGAGIKSLYLVTTTRIYRVPVTQITSASVTVFSSPSDSITEIPTGGTQTFAATSSLSTIEYISDVDAFIVGTTHASGAFSYFTKYVSSGQQFTGIFGRDYRYVEQSAKDNGHPTIFSNQSTVCGFQDSGNSNLLYICKQGTLVTTSHIYIVGIGNDWTYANSANGRLISPEFTLTNVNKFARVFINALRFVGTANLGKSTETFRVYFRTTNISNDATSGWLLLNDTLDISSFSSASSGQIMIEWKTLGESCLPARIMGANIVYEDNTTDSHYAFSVDNSSKTSKVFAWWFQTAFGSTVPPLKVNIYNSLTSALLLSDVSNAPTGGIWEKSTDNGVTWTSYNATDRVNSTTYIRYTPTSLGDNISVYPVLMQA